MVITGTNFTGATVVTFGGINAQSFIVNGPTQITAIPALGNTGVISVTSPLGTGTSAGIFTFTTPPPAPNPVTATPSTICQGSTSQLNATAGVNDIQYWYTVPSGGVSIGSSLSGVNFPVSPAITTTYYAENGGPVGPGGTQTFSYTGGVQTFSVPAGVTSITVDVKGGKGGNGVNGSIAGNGGRVQGTISVTPGSTLEVYVGGMGTDCGVCAIGAFNGGGGTVAGIGQEAGTGGGASDIRVAPYGLADRLFVAGGGGGGGYTGAAADGGAGGALIGGDGQTWNGYAGGTGGTQVAGGIGGLGQGGQPSAISGSLGLGGAGQGWSGGGGGGGGGYYGGGGGFIGGGGGGSNFADPSATGVTHTQDFQPSAGEVIITWVGAPICPSPRVPVTVMVNPATVLASANPAIICPGGSSVLSASGGVSYVWNPGGLIGNPTVNPAVTTTYTVTGTNAQGCTATSTVTVTVTGAPNIVATATPAAICIGSSSILSATGGATYLWNPGGLVGSPTVTPAVTTTYTVTGTVGGGCTGTSVVTVTVSAIPAVPNPVTATPATICVGASSQLNATAGINDIMYWYTVPLGGIAIGSSPSGANFPVSPLATTTYYVENGGVVAPGGSQTFNFTGSAQTFTVPAGVTSIHIIAKGAEGGGSQDCANTITQDGGLGGSAEGDLNVVPGQVLNIYVGEKPTTFMNANSPGGYNGGGGAGQYGGPGGGASDVRVGGNALADRVIVAGGGGGGNTGCPDHGAGGAGGGLNGSDGLAFQGYVPGGGASQIAGGVAGSPPGAAGALGLGAGTGNNYHEGGGGGGYYGGGSAYAAGGGGGSSYIGGVTGGITTSGVQSGNGQVIISWSGAGICPSARVPVTVTVNPAPPVTANASPLTICAGGSSVLTGGGAVSYLWNPGGLVGNPTVTPVVTTTYTVTGTVAAGCTATSVVTVTVSPFPNITATATPPIICIGGSATLDAGGAQTYVWNPGGLIGTPVLVTPAVTTTYTVTGTVAGGCTGSQIVTVTVNPIPAVPNPVTATPNNICQGATSQLNATAAVNDIMYWYTVPIGGVAIGNSLSGVNFPVTPAVTTTYYVENGGQVGPGGTQTFNYTGAVQNFTVPAGVTTLTIDARGAQGGTFGPALGGLGAKMVGDVTVVPGQVLSVWVGQQGIASQNAGGGGGGSGVTNGATPLVIAGGGGGGCSVNLEAGKPGLITTSGGNSSGAGGVGGNGGEKGYVSGDCGWAGGGGGFLTDGYGGPSGGDGGALPGTLSGPASGKSCLNLGLGGVGGCCGFSPLGSGGWGCGGGGRAEYGGGGGGGYSGGGGGQYVAIVGSKGGGGGGSYNTGINQNNTPGAQAGNGQVIITWSGAGGCPSARVPVTVTVNPAPTVTATATPASICVGGSSVLTASGANSYVWNPGGLIGSPTVSPAVTTTYTVTGTNGNGCTATATVTVTVNNVPIVTATASPSIICVGASSVLTGGGAATYTWNPGGLVGSPTVTPAVTTTYTVTGTVGAGCSATSVVTVTVNAAPAVTASASPTTICAGGSSVLTGGGAATYLWNPGGLVGSPTVSPAVTTTYTVTGSVAGGCTATSVVTVTVSPGITVTASANPPTICVGASSVLTGSGAATYTWNPGGLGGSPTVSPVVTTTYTVTGSNGAGCTGTSVVTVTVVNLNPIIVNTGGVLSVLNGPYTTYQWFLNGNPIAGATNPTYTVVQNGTYEVEVTLNNCTKRSANIILNGVGFNDVQISPYSISPNPTSDKITIQGVMPAVVKILNMQGQVVKEVRNTNEVSLANLSDGLYFIKLFDEKGRLLLNQKVTKK